MDKDMEEWKDIKGYEGLYQVSNLGRIKSIPRAVCNGFNTRHIKERIRVQVKSKSGYMNVGLNKDGKFTRFRVHRLVAEAFLPNPHNYVEINHKDEDKANNHITNLEWCGREKNCNHGTRNKRISEYQSKPVVQISMTGEIVNTFSSASEAEKAIGAKGGHIGSCCQGKRKTAHGYMWRYR